MRAPAREVEAHLERLNRHEREIQEFLNNPVLADDPELADAMHKALHETAIAQIRCLEELLGIREDT